MSTFFTKSKVRAMVASLVYQNAWGLQNSYDQNGKQKLIDEAEEDAGKPLGENHPLRSALKALEEASKK